MLMSYCVQAPNHVHHDHNPGRCGGYQRGPPQVSVVLTTCAVLPRHFPRRDLVKEHRC